MSEIDAPNELVISDDDVNMSGNAFNVGDAETERFFSDFQIPKPAKENLEKECNCNFATLVQKYINEFQKKCRRNSERAVSSSPKGMLEGFTETGH